MPKSILIVTGIFPPDSGGPSKFSMEFGSWAAKKNFEVIVRTYSDDQNMMSRVGLMNVFPILRSKSLVVRYIRMIKGIGNHASSAISVLAVGAFLETYISSIIYRFKYTVKVPGDIVWERARNNGVTDLSIEDFQQQRMSFKYQIFRKLFSNSLKRAQTVIVPSRGLYNLCLTWGVSEMKLKLIHNAVEQLKSQNTSMNSPEFDFVTICRLAPWKGVDEIINYCADRNLKLAIAGDGPDRPRLESLAKKQSAHVTFMGNISAESVIQLLSNSKIFVLNSYYEGLPHALVEARAAGVLSVARAGTGSEEVINDDVDGYLVRADRPLDVTLDLALASQTNTNEFIRKAKDDANSRFNKETNYSEILKIVEGVQ